MRGGIVCGPTRAVVFLAFMACACAAVSTGCQTQQAARSRTDTQELPADLAAPFESHLYVNENGTPSDRHNSSAPAPESNEGIALLKEYEAAYQAQDIERLARVWDMNPFERLTMSTLFANYESLSMSVVPRAVHRSGRGLFVDFDQTSGRLQGRILEARFRASMIRRSSGEWVILSLKRRGAPPLIRRNPDQDQGPLATVREFQSAFERRDINRLASVWLMSPSERDTTERIFNQRAHTKVGFKLWGVESKGNRAIVDFDQRLITATRRPVQSGLDRLRAWIVRAADGRWVISKVLPRPH